ncbi:hypothetical protein EG328_007892 [Venturia inaequalis]|nr:hypothetical protein EG328_007892 [Venturia inaequalis]KAE9972730.1 hypothetical protein EG327_009384 [Venturia inaequalis]RDI77341.1 hypothetical protein Vi05172_g12651 [Venturia inaequalis]
MAPSISLFSINAILILSADDGSRLYSKYYQSPHPPLGTPAGSTNYAGASAYPTLSSQKAFETGLREKTVKTNADVILYDNRVVTFKTEGDVILYVVGSADENEILLFNAILALRDSLTILLKSSVDKRTILENYDLVTLAIDELCDDGVLLETDPVTVSMRVSRAPAQDMAGAKGIDLSEQGLLNAWEFAKMKGLERLRQGL